MNQLAKLSNETLISLIKRKQWDAIINKCRACSSAEYLHRESTNFNRTALSLVLTLKPPIEVVRAFVSHEAFGEALYTRDTYCDYLPIHCAVRYRASSDIVSLLIRSVDASANMLEITDRNMMTPLHIACNFGYSPRVINALVRGNPGVLKLEAKTRKTPLMLACGCKMTKPSTIKTLLAHPTRTVTGSMPNTRSCGEWTPLHLAVLHNGSLEIIQLLCDAYPEACFQKTVTSNQTPLGLYRSGHGENAEIIELLLSPTSRKCGRYYPGVIHQVLSFPQFIPGLLEFVLDNFATHAQIRDVDGRLPLHVAIQKCEYTYLNGVHNSEEVEHDNLIESLGGLSIDVRPRYVYPKQSIYDASNKDDAWKRVLECYPSAIRVQDKEHIFPFMLAAACSRTDIAFELLRSAPDVISHVVQK